jgi:hypothetical protein
VILGCSLAGQGLNSRQHYIAFTIIQPCVSHTLLDAERRLRISWLNYRVSSRFGTFPTVGKSGTVVQPVAEIRALEHNVLLNSSCCVLNYAAESFAQLFSISDRCNGICESWRTKPSLRAGPEMFAGWLRPSRCCHEQPYLVDSAPCRYFFAFPSIGHLLIDNIDKLVSDTQTAHQQPAQWRSLKTLSTLT